MLVSHVAMRPARFQVSNFSTGIQGQSPFGRWRIVRLFTIFILLSSGIPTVCFATPRDEASWSCIARNASIVAMEARAAAKFFALHYIDLFRPNATGMPVTRRGFFRYIWNLNLEAYDFRNKTILDVGAGKSPFVPTINKYFRKNGTRAVALDLQAKRRFVADKYARADAQQMPYADDSFDLTVSSWLLNNIDPRTDLFKNILKEMIRVTKPGGEIRLLHVASESDITDLLKAWLPTIPKVGRFAVQWLPFRGYYRIVLH